MAGRTGRRKWGRGPSSSTPSLDEDDSRPLSAPVAAAPPTSATSSTGSNSNSSEVPAAALSPPGEKRDDVSCLSERPRSVDDAKRRTSPRGSPLLRRLSTFIKGKKTPASAGGVSSDRPGSRWRRRAPPAKELAVVPPRGHTFAEAELSQPTWCDHCDDVIWGLFKQCMQCQDCSYTCHRECAPSVTLGCRDDAPTSDSSATSSRPGSGNERAPHRTHHHPKENLADVEAGAAGLLAYLSATDIAEKIAEYNKLTKRMQMELLDDPSGKAFKGYIRVSLSLTRPIRVTSEDSFFANVSPENTGMEELPTPLATAVRRSFQFGSGSGSGKTKMIDSGTAFYLPKNVTKGLFVTSATTSQEVISILLRKFKVISNPRKFALYELDLTSGSKRRLRRFEEPLVLQLLWGGDNTDFRLSLQETNDDHEFQWEEFSLPELENFLRILDAEEAHALEEVSKRFELRKRRLEDALQQSEAMPDNDIEPEAGQIAADNNKKPTS